MVYSNSDAPTPPQKKKKKKSCEIFVLQANLEFSVCFTRDDSTDQTWFRALIWKYGL